MLSRLYLLFSLANMLFPPFPRLLHSFHPDLHTQALLFPPSDAALSSPLSAYPVGLA
jgi:hypothetical protein